MVGTPLLCLADGKPPARQTAHQKQFRGAKKLNRSKKPHKATNRKLKHRKSAISHICPHQNFGFQASPKIPCKSRDKRFDKSSRKYFVNNKIIPNFERS